MVAGSAIQQASIPSTLFDQGTNDEAGAIVMGAPVYADAPGGVKLAKADVELTAFVVGLLASDSVPATEVAAVATSGSLVATTAEWDVITGGAGGLTPGATYYLDPTTAGMLTTVKPSSPNFVTQVGIALATDTMLVQVVPYGLPSGSGDAPADNVLRFERFY
jgi:hypothetical protein